MQIQIREQIQRAGCDGKPGNAVPRCFQRVTRRRPRGKCMLRWLAPLSHKYKALLSDKYKRHCLCHKRNALLGQILQNDLFVTQTQIRGERE